jgi:hypothetical protein
MLRKLVSVLIVLVLVLGLASAVHGDLTVGVKKGDWIEYAITTTGTPSEGHDINWSRMEVTDSQGTSIIVYITSRFINGSTANFNSTLNLKTGHLIDDFIIPANLKSGDTFLDEKVGKVTITNSEQHSYAGAMRTVLSAYTSQSTYIIWDQATGVSVEATSQLPDYSMHTIIEETNMWQTTQELDMTSLLLIYVAVIIVIIAIALLALRYRKKKPTSKRLMPFLMNA